jgi:hypothetical protein
VIVTGDDGREALALALGIMLEIERSLPALAGAGAGQHVGGAHREKPGA